MIEDLVRQICTELDISPVPKLNEKKFISFQLGEEIEMEMRDLSPGLSLFSRICSCPAKKREELFLRLMRANYLGQATGNARIGMSQDEKFLTLSLGLPYELSYRNFRETIEDFINFVFYWREEIQKFETQETLL